MHTPTLPHEKAWPFLLVRRGIPLALGATSLVLALLLPHAGGWLLLAFAACLAEVWPTFRGGAEHLRSRSATIRWDGRWVRALRPVARWFGREESWILSFCAWNNRKVREVFEARRARKALVLLPHCIQLASCKADVIEDLGHCFSCGRCPAGDVLAVSLSGRWDCRISNRSHKAYRDAREFKPDLIVAVSCSDRLLKGITKLPEIPCYVIPLSLPHGMCVDTTFSVSHLQTAMACLVEPKAELKSGPEAELEASPRVEPLQVRPGA